MEDGSYSEHTDYAKEALLLCSTTVLPHFGNQEYADASALTDRYGELEGGPNAENLSLAVADLLDYPDADVRVIAAYFFTRWPRAVGHERRLDVIESGPRRRVETGDGVLWPAYVPRTIPECFEKALNQLADADHPRAQGIRSRSDISDLLRRAAT